MLSLSLVQLERTLSAHGGFDDGQQRQVKLVRCQQSKFSIVS